MRFRRIVFLLLVVLILGSIPYALRAYEIREDVYIIGPGDVLEIRAWNRENPDLLIVNPPVSVPAIGVISTAKDPHTVTVSRDGRIYIPMVGVVKVSGMTVKELEDMLKVELKKFARGAQVTVLLQKPKEVRVYVMGQVGSPGLYGVPDGAPEEARIMNFINLAGGFTDYANLSQVKVIRKIEDQEVTINLDFRRIERERDLTQNMILKQGDTVVVPSASNKVYVLGQVVSPGAYNFVEGATLINYLSEAGGLTKTAVTEAGIIRGEGKQAEVIKTNVNQLLGGGPGPAMEIKAGDIIYVPQSWFANWADILGSLSLIRNTLTIPRDTRDAYLDLTGQPRKTYVPTE